MTRTTPPYRAGDLIAVPLRTSKKSEGVCSFGIGLICSHDGHGVCAGYFFAGVHDSIPGLADLKSFGPADVVLTARFGHLGLVKN